jgi:hypothetical protein
VRVEVDRDADFLLEPLFTSRSAAYGLHNPPYP